MEQTSPNFRIQNQPFEVLSNGNHSEKPRKYVGNFRVYKFGCFELWHRTMSPTITCGIFASICIASWILNYPFMSYNWKQVHFYFAFIFFFLYYRACFTNPGVIPPVPKKEADNLVTIDLYDNEDEEEDEEDRADKIRISLGEEDPIICQSCNLRKSAGGTHCNVCGFCVKGFDHHCSVLQICVARRNFIFFWIWLSWFYICFLALGYLFYDLYFRELFEPYTKFIRGLYGFA